MARPHTLRAPDPAKAGRAHKCVRVALRPEVYAAAKAVLRDGESVPDLVGKAVEAEVVRRKQREYRRVWRLSAMLHAHRRAQKRAFLAMLGGAS